MKNRIISGFIEHQKGLQKAESTLRSYQSDLIVFARWFQKTNHETLAFKKMTPTDLRHFKRFLVDKGYKPSIGQLH